MLAGELQKSQFPQCVQRYLDLVNTDILTKQNGLIVEDLLGRIEEAGKMNELEEMLQRHGDVGLQAPYSELIHSGNLVLEEPKTDGRSITVMSEMITSQVVQIVEN